MKYIDADKLIAEIERRISIKENLTQCPEMSDMKESLNDIIGAYQSLKSFITSLQQEQSKDKQIIIITESHGDANIEWDCRSLEDVMILLKSAEHLITDKLERSHLLHPKDEVANIG